MSPHNIEIRVYYEDTDFSENVYHAAYLHFLERGRTEFLRAHGIHHSELIADGIAFAVRSMNIEFERAAHIDDLLTVETSVAGIGGARLVLDQAIRRGEERIAAAHIVVAAIKIGGGATRLPKALRAAISA